MTPREMLNALEQEARRSLRHGYAEVECQHILGVVWLVRELEERAEKAEAMVEKLRRRAVNVLSESPTHEMFVEGYDAGMREVIRWIDQLLKALEKATDD